MQDRVLIQQNAGEMEVRTILAVLSSLEPFRGLLIVRLNQAIPTGTTTTLPVVFTSSGGNPQRLTGFNGADITVAQISGTGIYLCWFEHTTNTLQLLTGVV